ncbi:hypothetical protein LUX12_07015 [Streptomyces somaliensis]|uniref:hypothetical protein n=1 Tax=Streptomyces somaliensis TaxID=78355 RepID=UPI0020CD9B3B|nr:hypothetical protein [Streptomyces somaliensis]MCP9944590.1 hypothetical protein [Streptomyces somaliensis]
MRGAGPSAGFGSPGWGLYAVYAVYAVLLAVLTALPTHRVWGTVAAVGYGIAAVLAAYRPHRPRWLPGAAAVLGATVVPLLLLGTARAQSEVRVVEDAAALLLRTGTPYFPAPDQLSEYNPYLPGMVVFGLPRAFFGEGGVDGRAVVVHRRLRRRGAGRAPCDADAGAGWPGGGTGASGPPDRLGTGPPRAARLSGGRAGVPGTGPRGTGTGRAGRDVPGTRRRAEVDRLAHGARRRRPARRERGTPATRLVAGADVPPGGSGTRDGARAALRCSVVTAVIATAGDAARGDRRRDGGSPGARSSSRST